VLAQCQLQIKLGTVPSTHHGTVHSGKQTARERPSGKLSLSPEGTVLL